MRAAALTAVVLVACGARPGPANEPAPPAAPEAAPPPPEPPDAAMAEVIAALRAHRDRTCACTAAACVDAAEVAQFEWGFAHQALLDRVKPTPAQEAEAAELIEATEACAHAFR